MKKIIIIVAVCVIFTPSLVFAVDMCLDAPEAIKVANDLAKLKKYEEILQKQDEALKKDEERIVVLEKIIDNMEKIDKLKDGQIEAQGKAIDSYRRISDTYADTVDHIQRTLRPSIWDRLQSLSVGAVIGAILVGAFLL